MERVAMRGGCSRVPFACQQYRGNGQTRQLACSRRHKEAGCSLFLHAPGSEFRSPVELRIATLRAAEGEFSTLLENLHGKERAVQPKLDYAVFRRGMILHCKQRISKGG